jgi:competence protein ComGF
MWVLPKQKKKKKKRVMFVDMHVCGVDPTQKKKKKTVFFVSSKEQQKNGNCSKFQTRNPLQGFVGEKRVVNSQRERERERERLYTRKQATIHKFFTLKFMLGNVGRRN